MSDPNGKAGDEKRRALELVFQSRTFRRCDQLKRMLEFICEAEINGQADQLNEYLIGVEAFGRSPSSYNPAEDSTVRTRAYELRNKLTKFYTLEAPEAPLQIVIDRGAYIPRFVRQFECRGPSNSSSAAERTEGPSSVPAIAVTPAAPADPCANPVVAITPAVRGWSQPLWVAATCLALAFAAYGWYRPTEHVEASASTRSWSPELEAFWKPFMSDYAPVLLTYQSRLFLIAPEAGLIVRNWRVNSADDIESSPALLQFRKTMAVDKLIQTRNYADFGSLNAVFTLMQTVGRRQNHMALKRSDDLDWTDIYNDNIIFVGGLVGAVPRLAKAMESGDFVENAVEIKNLRPKPGEQKSYRVSHLKASGANNGDKYALLSRFPGPRRGRYIMMLGSAHSELPWAIAEHITNPLSMRDLMQHLRLPSGELPEAFQVVLRVTLQAQVPVRVRYVTHHVVAAPEFPYEPDQRPATTWMKNGDPPESESRN